jgi:hypothetical protein
MNHKNITKSGKYNCVQGTFYPSCPEKYKGTSNPRFKSKLEYKMMRMCDKSPHVINWSYERIVIPYVDKSRHNTTHNYYMDFKVTMSTKNGPQTFLVEVKSKKETEKPKNSKRKKPENYKKEVETWVRNKCKWSAAEKSARRRGWRFVLFTEDQLD